MSETDRAQADMDRLFGVKAGSGVERPAQLDSAKPERNATYSRALLEARSLFPNDETAQNRFAERSADRALQMSAAAKSPARRSEKILLDEAFLDVFGGITGGAGMRLTTVETHPDRVIGRGVDGKLYQVPYATEIDGITFGSPQLIENLADVQ